MCIPKSAAPFPIAHVALDGSSVVACFLLDHYEAPNTGYPCIKVDPKAKTFDAAPSWWRGAEPAKRAFVVKTTASEVTVCKSGTTECTTVKPGFTAAKGELAADASPDGKRVFVVEVAGKGAFGDTFEVASGKRLARVPLTPPKDAGDKWSVAWVGKRVQVTAHRCCSPEGSSELVDPQSGASLGLGDVNALVKAKGDRFVVGTESEAAAKLAVVSDDGKLLKDLGPIAAKGYGEPELHVLDGVALPDGTAAIVHANPPGVVIVDVDALSVSADLPIPVCTW